MNDLVHNIASFQAMRNPDAWRWSHARHHTDTCIVGRDPAIAFMRPPRVVMLALGFIGVTGARHSLKPLRGRRAAA